MYLVCEPPGEPYYLGRIMEFLHSQNDASRPVDAVRINWFYRPKDIGRKVTDTRVVFATMHSDISPLAALRGKCQIRHRAEIERFDEYRKSPDCFWYEKLYDRYIQKHYDLIPTKLIVNVPDRVKKVLDERWKFVLVEQGRGKELTSAVKSCKRCSGYCARYVQFFLGRLFIPGGMASMCLLPASDSLSGCHSFSFPCLPAPSAYIKAGRQAVMGSWVGGASAPGSEWQGGVGCA